MHTLACNFIKKEALAQVFSCEFCKISKNTFSYRTPPVAPVAAVPPVAALNIINYILVWRNITVFITEITSVFAGGKMFPLVLKLVFTGFLEFIFYWKKFHLLHTNYCSNLTKSRGDLGCPTEKMFQLKPSKMPSNT